jgi:hypothetical protein
MEVTKSKTTQRRTQEEFIEKSISIHNNFYDYSLVRYINRQHYEPVSDFGGDIEFEKIKIRDSIKNIYCLNNNINLIIIKYTDDEVKQKICSLLYAAS